MSKITVLVCVDFKTYFATLNADQNWIGVYLDFIMSAKPSAKRSHRHHILPRAMFPEFESFKFHSWNCKRLTLSDHFVVHYYLYRAMPQHPVAFLSFIKMASATSLNGLIQSNYDESLVREMSLEYERIRSGAVSLNGWLHVYKGEQHTVISAEELDSRLAHGWTQTAPPRQWVHKGEESYRAPIENVQSYLDRGFVLGRNYQHSEITKSRMSDVASQRHKKLHTQGGNAYNFMPHGDQHHRKDGCPDEVADKISKTLGGRKLSKEHAAKVRVAAKGKTWKWSPEARKRLSEQRHGSGNNRFGKRGYWAGKTRPESTRQKMSASHKARITNKMGNISILG